jgi:hypothetical protein
MRHVAPSTSPVGTFVFHATPAGEFVIDSLPSQLEQFPYLATVALELPAFRPRSNHGKCRAGSTWTDSAQLGPIPVPGVDSMYSRYRASYRAQADSGDAVVVLARSEISRTGRSAGATVLVEQETRTSRWRLVGGCSGPASLDEERRSSIVYTAVRDQPADTVTSVERRRIAAASVGTR